MKLVASAVSIAVVAADPSTNDLLRANRAVPRDHVRANDPAAIRSKLNTALLSGPVAMPQATACEDFSLEELAKLQVALFAERSAELPMPGLRAPRHSRAAELDAEHKGDAEYARKYPEVLPALRDGRCAEIASAWVHQVSEDMRGSFAKTKLPLLANKGTAEHSPDLIQGGHHHIANRLVSQVTCAVGHSAQSESRVTWEGFPKWPSEVEYNASGYGPYPFWTAGGGSGGSLTDGAPIHTRWSSVLNAERLDHNGDCSLSGMGWKKDAPCTHLFLSTKYAYLFDQEQTHCCISSDPDYVCALTASPRDLTSLFNYDGVVDDYVSESGYYSGSVKKYSMHLTTPSKFWFWYVTDMDDKPIEQGEGACSMMPRGCSGPPKYLFHQYNPDTFKETTLDPEVFAVPEVCKNTQSYCEVKPTRFCGSGSAAEAVV